jgi:hypothetical protein
MRRIAISGQRRLLDRTTRFVDTAMRATAAACVTSVGSPQLRRVPASADESGLAEIVGARER